MKKAILLTVLGVLFIAGAAVVAQANTVTLDIEAGGGAWQVYADVSGDNNGLSSFIIDVVGSGGASVTGSTMEAPFGFDTVQFGLFGFENRNDGSLGIGIYAGQPTMYGGLPDPEGLDTLVLKDVGISAGSHYGTTWDAPVLLASGTYECAGPGELTVDVGDGQFNVLDSDWTGPGNVHKDPEVVPDSVDVCGVVIPEPAALSLLVLGGIGAMLRRGRR